MKRKKHSHDGAKLAVSLSASLLSILVVAAFCSSSSKTLTSATINDADTDPSTPVTWSPDMFDALFGTSTDGSTDAPVEDTSGTTSGTSNGTAEETNGNDTFFEETNSTSPSTKPTVTTKPADTTKPSTTSPSTTKPNEDRPKPPMFRDFYEDEKLIDRYMTGEVCLTLSKVERGNLNYFICDIILASPEALHTAFASGQITGRHYTSAIAESVGATFAVNGDFCGFRNHGIIFREGKLYRSTTSDWDLCYIDKNGDLNAVPCKSVNANTLKSNGVLQSWCFGPTLVSNYEIPSTFNTPGLSQKAREPRVAIGQLDTLHYVILVVDAVRTNNTTVGGMTFTDLAKEFQKLGCKTAYNLDGGGSTTLYYKGKVINTPCGSGERKVSDIIYLK